MKRLIILLAITSFACSYSALSLSTLPTKEPVTRSTPANTPQAVMVVCKSYGLRLRVDAGVDSQQIDTLADGTKVVLTGNQKTPYKVVWYEVAVNGVTGWVSSKYLCLQ